MKKLFIVKTLVLSSIVSLFLSGCCMFGKAPCVGCNDRPGHKWGQWGHKECPFAGCLMKTSCYLLKNKEELSLTDDQVSRIKAISEKREKDSIQLKADARKVYVDIKTEFSDENFDASGINALIDKKFDLKKQIVKSFVNSHAEILAVLTSEQREKLKEIKKECKKSKCCD